MSGPKVLETVFPKNPIYDHNGKNTRIIILGWLHNIFIRKPDPATFLLRDLLTLLTKKSPKVAKSRYHFIIYLSDCIYNVINENL